MEFRNHRLDNGLEIIAETNADAHSMSVAFLVRTGSRDEADDVAGVSHFLEHMCFKGTPRRSADDVNREFDEIGAHYNAFTSEECTAYYASVLPEYQEASVDILADILRPSLRPDDFDMEKKVILEEIQMYLDQPPFGMDDRIKQLHMGRHPLARSVLGTSKRCWRSRRRRCAIISLRGTRRTMCSLLQRAKWTSTRSSSRSTSVVTRGNHRVRSATCRELRRRRSFEVIHRPTATQQYVLQLADAPASEDEDRYAAKLLATIVGDDSGSRMYWELTDPGLAETASLGHYEYLGAGMFYTWLACEPDSVEENLERLRNILVKVEMRRRDRGRTEPGEEQSEGPRRAGQRAAAKPAVQRRRQLAATPRVSHRGRRFEVARWRDGRADSRGARKSTR